MTKTEQLQEALNDVWERYGNILRLLNDSIDQNDELKKQIKNLKEDEHKQVIIKEIEKIVEKEVPGPERVVERLNPVNTQLEQDNTILRARIVELENAEPTVIEKDNEETQKLKNRIIELEEEIQQVRKSKEVVKEVVKQVPVAVTESTENDLRHTARLLVNSELNKEDLSEEELIVLLQRSSEDDVKRQIGFWATPLPTDEQTQTEKRYIGKK